MDSANLGIFLQAFHALAFQNIAMLLVGWAQSSRAAWCWRFWVVCAFCGRSPQNAHTFPFILKGYAELLESLIMPS